MNIILFALLSAVVFLHIANSDAARTNHRRGGIVGQCPSICTLSYWAAAKNCWSRQDFCKVKRQRCSLQGGRRRGRHVCISKGPKNTPTPTPSPSPIPLVFDINGDGVEDADDLVEVLRTIDDPLGVVAPQNMAADYNGDGVVDLADAQLALEYLTNKLGPAAFAPLNTTYSSTHNFDWNQSNSMQTSGRIQADQRLKTVRTILHGDTVRQSATTCGQQTLDSVTKGSGSDPSIPWDSGFQRDPAAVATIADYWNWVEYGIKLAGATVFLPDGAKAYRRYRENSGAQLTVDYEKAIVKDSAVKTGVEEEINAVRAAAKQLHDGQEASFKFHSNDARLVNTVTENWDKALGGHRIWSFGSVTYDKSMCQLKVDFTIKMEDFYNFNKGQKDKVTGLPDDDNGRFEVLGWAKSFFSRASIMRSETIDLQCCKDEDCGSATEFDCTCNKCTAQCPTNQKSGGQGFQSFTVDLFKTQGQFEVFYQMYTIPDELTIFFEGATIFATGGLVSGTKTTTVSYGPSVSNSTLVTVEVNAPQSGTAWIISVSCPP